ncbi:hypothetical protein RchiOBHm_Chr5g0038411 [Rosa chinensis]|uniref:Uncharacterized protein n=1 Tax=Rosa chinensis TaxID=74649 RepID=A0A2P6QC01_ROSCH|nr:hypothetical protein RchiOBHm_Chr5g0038411 [Rosa chinensis]
MAITSSSSSWLKPTCRPLLAFSSASFTDMMVLRRGITTYLFLLHLEACIQSSS